jgi:hypothetical protein
VLKYVEVARAVEVDVDHHLEAADEDGRRWPGDDAIDVGDAVDERRAGQDADVVGAVRPDD